MLPPCQGRLPPKMHQQEALMALQQPLSLRLSECKLVSSSSKMQPSTAILHRNSGTSAQLQAVRMQLRLVLDLRLLQLPPNKLLHQTQVELLLQ